MLHGDDAVEPRHIALLCRELDVLYEAVALMTYVVGFREQHLDAVCQ